MSREIKKLQNQRKGYQININGHLKSVDELVAAELNSETADQLTITVESLHEYQQKLENLNSKIVDNLDDDEELEKEAVDSATYFDTILSSIKTAEHKVSKFHGSRTLVADSDNSSLKSATSASRKAAAKLPKLEITPFDGDPIKCQEFWDTFQTTIDNSPDLNDIDKLKYLKRFLASDVVNVIDGFRVTSANYKVIVDTLKERYGNPEIAIHAHFEKLIALPSCQKDSSKFQNVYDECEKHIRSLVALGLEEETFGKVFTPIILSKLPSKIRVQICRSNGSQPWELRQLRSLMRKEINVREMSNRYSETGRVPTESKMDQQIKQTFLHPTQSTLSNTTSEPIKKVSCSYCSNDHYADQCDVYTTLHKRREKLNGRCLRCLSPNHKIRDCNRKNICFYCKKDNHHSSLCFTKFDASTIALDCKTSSTVMMAPTTAYNQQLVNSWSVGEIGVEDNPHTNDMKLGFQQFYNRFPTIDKRCKVTSSCKLSGPQCSPENGLKNRSIVDMNTPQTSDLKIKPTVVESKQERKPRTYRLMANVATVQGETENKVPNRRNF